MTINLYEWLLNDYSIDVIREFAYNFIKQNHQKKFHDVFPKLKKELGAYNAVKTIFQTTIDWNEKYGYADVDWENDVSPNWKIYLMNEVRKTDDIDLIWDTHELKTTGEKRMETFVINNGNLDQITYNKDQKRFIEAISKKIYTDPEAEVYHDNILAFVDKYLVNKETGELIGECAIKGNIKFSYLNEIYKNGTATAKDLLRIVSMYKHGINSHNWILDETKETYLKWLEGDAENETVFWESSTKKITFDAVGKKLWLHEFRTNQSYSINLSLEELV